MNTLEIHKFWGDHRYAPQEVCSLSEVAHSVRTLVFYGAAFGRDAICIGLWHPPAMLLKQVCVFGRHFYTHTAGSLYTNVYVCLLCGCVPLNWSISPWSEWEVGKSYKPTHGSTNLHECILVFTEVDYCSQQTAAFSLSPFVFFSMKILNILRLSEVFLAIQNHIFVSALCSPNTWGSKWQALETDGCSAHSWEVFLISPISYVLSSCSPLYPQCILHLPQLCRDNLHSPSSLAATPSCPWAKKSPYCSKEHMQQSLMLTLIVPIQTTQ